MPSSLIVVALVVAWLVVLVPMIVRKRQEIARTADSALAARVVRSGSGEEGVAEPSAEEAAMRDADEVHDDLDEAPVPEETEDAYPVADHRAAAAERRYRPGRGGFDPEAAAVIAKAKYAYRQRVVLAMIVGSVVTAVGAGVVFPVLWWAHGAIDLMLVGYLAYLRRQVRIEQEIRERRLARMVTVRRSHPHTHAHPRPAPMPEPEPEEDPARRERVADGPRTQPPPPHHPGAVVVDVDDEDPAFDDLDEPGSLPYRRAVGE